MDRLVMVQWAENFLNWLTTVGLGALLAYGWRLSYRITKLEKDVSFLSKEQSSAKELDSKQEELLLEIRDRLTRLEVVLNVNQEKYNG